MFHLNISINITLYFSFQPVRDNTYGSLYENGSWSGMIGEVISGVCIANISYLFVLRVYNIIQSLLYLQ